MLPASHRLRSAREIKEVLTSGRWYRSEFFHICRHTFSSNTDPVKAACVVGKKVSLSAVVRHKYQRWLREAVFNEIIKPKLLNGSKLVLVAQPSIKKVTSLTELTTSLRSLLSRM